MNDATFILGGYSAVTSQSQTLGKHGYGTTVLVRKHGNLIRLEELAERFNTYGEAAKFGMAVSRRYVELLARGDIAEAERVVIHLQPR